jgi:predicted ArsR family transcriptional regulator
LRARFPAVLLQTSRRASPLAAVVRQHPKVCKALEAMIGELAGVTVREHCDRSDERPRCCFQLVGLH